MCSPRHTGHRPLIRAQGNRAAAPRSGLNEGTALHDGSPHASGHAPDLWRRPPVGEGERFGESSGAAWGGRCNACGLLSSLSLASPPASLCSWGDGLWHEKSAVTALSERRVSCTVSVWGGLRCARLVAGMCLCPVWAHSTGQVQPTAACSPPVGGVVSRLQRAVCIRESQCSSAQRIAVESRPDRLVRVARLTPRVPCWKSLVWSTRRGTLR